MKRMTVHFKIQNEWTGIETTKREFQSVFLRYLRVTIVSKVEVVNPDSLYIELNSDHSQIDLVPFLNGLASRLNLQYISISLGWRLSDDQYFIRENGSNGINDFQPIKFTGTAYFVISMIVSLLALAGFVLFVLLNIVNKSLSTFNNWLIFIGACALTCYALFQTREVICNQNDLTIKYWFPVMRKIPWRNISGLRIIQWRRLACKVELVDGFGFYLPVDEDGLKNSRELINTIALKSKLQFVSGENWENSRYMRSSMM